MLIHELTLNSIIIRILLSVVCGGIIGFERGVKNQSAGLRTYIVVCLGAAMVMMTNQYVIALYGAGDPTRMGAQVISGLGFLGAGMIVVTDNQKIKGLTTAAGVWGSAVLGLAIGIGFYTGAILATLAIVGVMTLFSPLKEHLKKRSKVVSFHLVCESVEAYNRVLIFLTTSDVKIIDMQNAVGNVLKWHVEDEDSNSISCYLTLRLNESFQHLKVMEDLSQIAGVVYLEELS